MSYEIKDSAADKKVTVAEVKKSIDDLWGAFKKLQKKAELHWGKDIDGDGKVGSVRVAMLIVLLFAGIAFATSDVVLWYNSDATKGTAKITSDDAGAATLTVDKIVAASGITAPLTGAISATTITASGKVTTTPVAVVNVTNAQVVTLSGVINLLNSKGSANLVTNTMTLTDPSAAGVWAVVVNVDTASNLLAIAKTGNYYGPALELAAGESMILYSVATNKWHGIGQ